MLVFDRSNALLLSSDVVGSDHVPDTRLVKSAVKSLTRVRISIFCFNFQKCLHGFFSDQILILQAIQK